MDAIEVVMFVDYAYYINLMTQSYMVVKGRGQFAFSHQVTNNTDYSLVVNTIDASPVDLATIMLIVTWLLVVLVIIILIVLTVFLVLRCVHARAYKIKAQITIAYDTEAANQIIEVQPATQELFNGQNLMMNSLKREVSKFERAIVQD